MQWIAREVPMLNHRLDCSRLINNKNGSRQRSWVRAKCGLPRRVFSIIAKRERMPSPWIETAAMEFCQ
jgi:hypothetical protein